MGGKGVVSRWSVPASEATSSAISQAGSARYAGATLAAVAVLHCTALLLTCGIVDAVDALLPLLGFESCHLCRGGARQAQRGPVRLAGYLLQEARKGAGVGVRGGGHRDR